MKSPLPPPPPLLLLLLLLVAAPALHAHHHCCPPPVGKFPFDASKFSGEWFVVSSKPPPHMKEFEATCLKVTYSTTPHANETRVRLAMTVKGADGRTLQPEALGRFGRAPAGSVLQAVWRKDAAADWAPGVFHMSVPITDYATYAVVVSCKEMYVDKTDSFQRLFIPQVWARTPTLEPQVLAVLKNALSGLDVDEGALRDHANAAC